MDAGSHIFPVRLVGSIQLHVEENPIRRTVKYNADVINPHLDPGIGVCFGSCVFKVSNVLDVKFITSLKNERTQA